MMGDLAPGDLVQKILDLEKQSTSFQEHIQYLIDENAKLRTDKTMLTLERDRATLEAERWWQRLLDILARVHRDGGHYTEQVGIELSLSKADEVIADMHARSGSPG